MRAAAADGSTLWQTIFLSFSVIVILLETLRGWRLGLARQLVRLFAMIAAYVAAVFGGKMLLPVIRPMVELPDIALSTIAGALLALVVYVAITTAGAFLFKRTCEQPSRTGRLLWGVSGASLGIFFGAFTVWLLIVGVRSLGAIADAHSRTAEAKVPRAIRAEPAPYLSGRAASASTGEDSTLDSLARLKNSLELGRVGEVIKTADVFPPSAYQTLGAIGRVVSNPSSIQRFMSYPGAAALSEHPRIVALRDDPEIVEMVRRGRYLDLLQNRRIIEALNDSSLLDHIKKFDLQKALDYALQTQ